MICGICNKAYIKWIPKDAYENNLCLKCNKDQWDVFEKEHAGDYALIKELMGKGHSHHCACRQVWGDGECECDLYNKGYDPYGWMIKPP